MNILNKTIEMNVIAHIRTAFPSKFGIPRQSGLETSLQSRIVFEEPYRNPDALRGMEGFSHLWLIWQFSEAVRKNWSPTVRPPILGGNTRVGVFATRSPFRPNAIGLSSVRIEKILPHTEEGPVIIVSGADMMDNTPILDIKPYLAYVDSHPDALGGFTTQGWNRELTVNISEALLQKVPANLQSGLLKVLETDPRPTYQNDPERIYGMPFADMEIKFKVTDKTLIVTEILDKNL